jgi:hypothetical protein
VNISDVTLSTSVWGLRATPEDYDAFPPLGDLLFDRQPRVLSPDRFALAAYLAFGHHMSGRLESTQWVSPALAEAISVDAAPVWLHTVPVELYAKALPVGSRSVRVTVEGLDGFWPARRSTEPELVVMRSDLSRGARMTFTSLEVSSNAWLFATGRPAERRMRIAVACAVVFAEDLEMDRCVIPQGLVKADELTKLRQLTAAVRLDVGEE